MYKLKTMIGTWSSVEIQKAVRLGYKVLDVCEQHHFDQTTNNLFKTHDEKQEGNKGLEAIAKLCINSCMENGDTIRAKQRDLELLLKHI